MVKSLNKNLIYQKKWRYIFRLISKKTPMILSIVYLTIIEIIDQS